MPLVPLGPGWYPQIEGLLRSLGRTLPSAVLPPLSRFLDEVVKWNAQVDLTAAKTPGELVDLMLADAIMLADWAERWGGTWGDVGSGAGAPGLPLAILVPKVSMTLVEPKVKRVAFLRSVLGALARPDVSVVRCRSQELPEKSWDVAISRATLPPPEWLREGARLAKRAVGVLVARAELPRLAAWKLDAERDYAWPSSGAPRKLAFFVTQMSPSATDPASDSS